MRLRFTRVINKIKKFATSVKLVNLLNDLHFVQSFYVFHHQRHQSGRNSHANKLCARVCVCGCLNVMTAMCQHVSHVARSPSKQSDRPSADMTSLSLYFAIIFLDRTKYVLKTIHSKFP